jgi:hypothetical protein
LLLTLRLHLLPDDVGCGRVALRRRGGCVIEEELRDTLCLRTGCTGGDVNFQIGWPAAGA